MKRQSQNKRSNKSCTTCTSHCLPLQTLKSSRYFTSAGECSIPEGFGTVRSLWRARRSTASQNTAEAPDKARRQRGTTIRPPSLSLLRELHHRRGRFCCCLRPMPKRRALVERKSYLSCILWSLYSVFYCSVICRLLLLLLLLHAFRYQLPLYTF